MDIYTLDISRKAGSMAREGDGGQREVLKDLISQWRKDNPNKTLEDLAALFGMKVGSFRSGVMYSKRALPASVVLTACDVFGAPAYPLLGSAGLPELPGLTPDYLATLDPIQRHLFLEAVKILVDLDPTRLPAAVDILRNVARLSEPK